MFSDVLLIGCDLLQTQTAAQEKCKQGSCKPNLSPIVPVKGPNARPTFAGAGMDVLHESTLFNEVQCRLVSASRILLQTSNLLLSCLFSITNWLLLLKSEKCSIATMDVQRTLSSASLSGSSPRHWMCKTHCTLHSGTQWRKVCTSHKYVQLYKCVSKYQHTHKQMNIH